MVTLERKARKCGAIVTLRIEIQWGSEWERDTPKVYQCFISKAGW